MKTLKKLCVGGILFVMGVSMFLQKLTFSDPSNTGILQDIMGSILGLQSPKQICGTMFVAICVCALIFAIAQNFLTFLLFIGSILLIVFAVINNLSVAVASMSGLELGIMMAMVIIGLGMVLNSMFRFGTGQPS